MNEDVRCNRSLSVELVRGEFGSSTSEFTKLTVIGPSDVVDALQELLQRIGPLYQALDDLRTKQE